MSLPLDDVASDNCAQTQGYDPPSAVVHKAVSLLRGDELTAAYEDAWATWVSSENGTAWDTVTADGLAN